MTTYSSSGRRAVPPHLGGRRPRRRQEGRGGFQLCSRGSFPPSLRGSPPSPPPLPSPAGLVKDTSTGFGAAGAPVGASGTSPRASKVGLKATNSSQSLRWNRGTKALGGYSWLSPTMRHRTAASSSPGRASGLRRVLSPSSPSFHRGRARAPKVEQLAASRTPSGA